MEELLVTAGGQYMGCMAGGGVGAGDLNRNLSIVWKGTGEGNAG